VYQIGFLGQVTQALPPSIGQRSLKLNF
jgi:hypothetical protein